MTSIGSSFGLFERPQQFVPEILDRFDRLPILVGASGPEAANGEGGTGLAESIERETGNAA